MGLFDIFKKNKENEGNEGKSLKDLNFDCVREHKSAIDKVTSFSIEPYLTAK